MPFADTSQHIWKFIANAGGIGPCDPHDEKEAT
ncbi:MAG: hypothetical protein FD152_1727 [Xanthobacteraceae bacterium]|nr:MAG: hypothetical protein FD152_1727 [Xanthobacteraceae bacterium]